MMPGLPDIPQHISFLQKIKIKLFRFFRLHAGPGLRLYRGYGNESHCFVYGHALSLYPLPRKRYRNSFLRNATALLRLFMVKPMKQIKIQLVFEGQSFETTTENDGFFHFQWKPSQKLLPGTYPVKAILRSRRHPEVIAATAETTIVIPWQTDYTFISDIDDTFLISHSGNLRKRLFVLFTQNPRSRRPFENAVMLYRMLHGIDDNRKEDNTFFYVSSSEWNLYNYIEEFVTVNKLPEGIYLLNQIKTFSRIFATGQNNHSGKFTRITKIIEAFPERKFVLLGDDSQKDPGIYASIVKHFAANIFCVFIRRVNNPEKPDVLEYGKTILAAGTQFCYFSHSDDAIAFSRRIGLIQ